MEKSYRIIEPKTMVFRIAIQDEFGNIGISEGVLSEALINDDDSRLRGIFSQGGLIALRHIRRMAATSSAGNKASL